MFLFKILSKFIKVLHSNTAPREIALGFTLGLFPGLTPLWTLHNALILLCIALLKVHIPAAVFSFLVFSGIAYLMDPLFHTLGYAILVRTEFLHPLWTALYNSWLAPFTRFNNTVVMGSLLFSLAVSIPAFYLFRGFVVRYRSLWKEKVERLHIVKALRGSRFFQWYMKLKNYRG